MPIYTTRDEIEYLKWVAQRPDAIEKLRLYRIAAQKREEWGAIDKTEVLLYVDDLLRLGT